MLIKLRRGKKAQSLGIVALSATALFGIIALGLDAGRLYFQRRDVQNAADAGALAGAQELMPPDGNSPVTSSMVAKANCEAALYGIQELGGTPTDGTDCTNPAPNYSPNGSGFITETAGNMPVTVRVWTPSGVPISANEIHVRVMYNVPLTFAAVIGFTNSAVVADAYAHGGFLYNTYAVFGFQAGPGGGNTVDFDQNGYAQIDNGNSGGDICTPSNQGRVVSNSKWHAPNPHPGWLNINGVFEHLSASDTHAVRTYWYQTVNPVPVQEQAPNYEATFTPGASSYGGTGTVNIYPGLYTQSLNIPFAGDPQGNWTYIFHNGMYLFQNASLNITGGTVSNTSTGQPLMKVVGPNGFVGGYSDLGVGPDGITDGVEFVFDGNSTFSMTSPKTKAPSVFLVAPQHTPGRVTPKIAFFVRQTDTSGSPWTDQVDGTKATAGGFPVQIWGTVYVGVPNAAATLQAASAWQSPGNRGTYGITGELIAPRVLLMGGNLANEATINPSVPNGTPGTPACTGGYVANPAGLLVQFNPNYAPMSQGYAYLVK